MSRDNDGMNCRDRAGREWLRKENERAAHYERKQSMEYKQMTREIDELKARHARGELTWKEMMDKQIAIVFRKEGK